MMRAYGLDTIAPALVAVSAIALLSACGGADAQQRTTSSKPAVTEAAPIPILTATAAGRDVAVVIQATGTFVPDESSDVAPQVSGLIVKTLVDVGDRVETGQVLVLLDDRDARLKLEQARAALERAEAEAQRARTDARRSRELFEKGFTSRSDFDRVTTESASTAAAVAQARAQLASAEKALEDSTVRTPFSGHVTARPVAVGEYVTPASKVATVVRIQPIKLHLLVKESDGVKLRKAMPVHARVSGYPGVTFTGSLSALNVAIDPSSRAMTVEATFPNRDARVTPGMFASAQIHLPATEPAVFVPRDALIKIANANAVYAVADKRVQLRLVQLGEDQDLDGKVRVRAGLEAGAIVATTNLDRLFDGAAVQVVTALPDVRGAAHRSSQ